ncbi:MAG: DUF1922 domain-containing protein [Nitrososphaerota archaeon]|nr:DUF1922 domain-containing protein [Candidatus Bathyarchaeota archaeon]MDW8022797.1 DUF1922 domain-containing protein [Nitrososphaerota archaeon]
MEKVFGSRYALTVYIIVVCGKCGGYLLARSDQKTRTCPYCSSKVVLEKAKKVASAEDASKASVILRKLKEKAAVKGANIKLRR